MGGVVTEERKGVGVAAEVVEEGAGWPGEESEAR